MLLSIIIINFNTPELTADCINSIKKHISEIEYEIILIDNAPKVSYKLFLENLDPRIKYRVSAENIGFGRANNMGMEIAEGDYLLLLNSDTLFIDNSFLSCYQFMQAEENKHVGLTGCRLLNKDGSYQPSFYPFVKSTLWNYFASNNPLLSRIFNMQKHFEMTNETKQVGDVSGAFMLLRREVYEETKGFDPDFFLYCEETEWCRLRISKQYDIYFYPHAQLIHLGGQSAPKDLMYLQSQLSLALYWYKNGWLNYLGYIFCSWINGIYFLLSYPFGKPQGRQFIRKYINALICLFPYLLYEIPRYKMSFAGRPEALVYKKARRFFFGDTA